MSQARVPGPGELLLALREQAGLDLAALMPADGGESASTFLATGRDGTVSVLKISPDAVGDSAGRLRELVTRLRRRAIRQRGCWLPDRARTARSALASDDQPGRASRCIR
jgi:hypothetical protein